MAPHQSAETDIEIVAQVCAGDTHRFAQIVERYQRALTRVARSRLGRDDWAEEVVQECFMAVLRSIHTYDSQYSFRTWLWTILLNQCKAHFQRRARAPQYESLTLERDRESVGLPVASTTSPLANLLAKERSELLEKLMARLSPAQADALRLRFFGQLRFQEIADTMGCSLNTAKNRVKWGLLRLANLLDHRETNTATRKEVSEENSPRSIDSIEPAGDEPC